MSRDHRRFKSGVDHQTFLPTGVRCVTCDTNVRARVVAVRDADTRQAVKVSCDERCSQGQQPIQSLAEVGGAIDSLIANLGDKVEAIPEDQW